MYCSFVGKGAKIYEAGSNPSGRATRRHTTRREVYEEMRLRTVAAAVAIAVLLIAPAAWAQDAGQDKPAMDIPLYPGAEATMEVNLSNEDILPMVRALAPLLGQRLAAVAEAVSPDEVASVFKDVKRIQILQLDVAKAGVAERDVADFYARSLPKGSWNRVFWQSGAPAGTMAVYAQPGGEMIYAFRVRSAKQEDKSIKKVEVLEAEGKLDYLKLVSLAAKFAAAQASAK